MNNLSTASRIVLLICLLVHSLADHTWIISLFEKSDLMKLNYLVGFLYLLYPILGWIADVHVPRFRMIKLSLVLNILACILAFFFVIDLQFQYFPSVVLRNLANSVGIIALIVDVGSMGIYKANAIQFGLQQLQDASSEILSSFIHWYYWSIHLSSLSLYYVSVPVLFYYRNCRINLNGNFFPHGQNLQILGWLFYFPVALKFICVSTGLIVLALSLNKLDVHQVKINPFMTILKILRYTWKHKYPERRSAFTYWENKEPSRIDFGKQKYGGPFTNEEVEDMKTFFRLLTLMLSSFGFFLSDDSESLSSLVMRQIGCPKLTQFLMMMLSPNHIQLLIIIIGVPLYQLLIKKICIKYVPNLLTRIGIGLILCLIKQLAYPIVAYLTSTKDQQALSCGVKTLESFTARSYSATTLCLFANGQVMNNNGTCVSFCPEMITESDIFYLLLIPQIIEGVSSLLVFMTMLEFICAQAPHTMKGLLIGIWYAMLLIQYMGMNFVKATLDESNSSEWCIYGGVKGLCIFVSIVLYSVVCKYYHYRERDEVVNEQAIIEDLFERELMYETEDSESTHSS